MQEHILPTYFTPTEINHMLDIDHTPLNYVEGESINFLNQDWEFYETKVQKLTFINPPFDKLMKFFVLALIINLKFQKPIAMVMNVGKEKSSKWIRCMYFLKMLWCVNRRNVLHMSSLVINILRNHGVWRWFIVTKNFISLWKVYFDNYWKFEENGDRAKKHTLNFRD